MLAAVEEIEFAVEEIASVAEVAGVEVMPWREDGEAVVGDNSHGPWSCSSLEQHVGIVAEEGSLDKLAEEAWPSFVDCLDPNA